MMRNTFMKKLLVMGCVSFSFVLSSCGSENDASKILKIRERFSLTALNACEDDTLTKSECEVLINQTLPVMKLRYQYRNDTAGLQEVLREVRERETNNQRNIYRKAEEALRETTGEFYQGHVWNIAREYERIDQKN